MIQDFYVVNAYIKNWTKKQINSLKLVDYIENKHKLNNIMCSF